MSDHNTQQIARMLEGGESPERLMRLIQDHTKAAAIRAACEQIALLDPHEYIDVITDILRVDHPGDLEVRRASDQPAVYLANLDPLGFEEIAILIADSKTLPTEAVHQAYAHCENQGQRAIIAPTAEPEADSYALDLYHSNIERAREQGVIIRLVPPSRVAQVLVDNAIRTRVTAFSTYSTPNLTDGTQQGGAQNS